VSRRPRTDDELRALGVPQAVIDYRNGSERVWQAPLVKVKVEGPIDKAIPPSRKVKREDERREQIRAELLRRRLG
jgi:hypothetical protein